MRKLAVRYKEFPLYENTASLANSMSWKLLAFMLGLFLSPTILGYYALAMMAVRMPMTMVGTAASQVFYQRANEEKSLTGGVQTVVQEIHTRLIAAGIFPFILLIILAEELFTFIFGTDWLTAGTYARILAPWLFAVFVVSPITTLFGVLERQRAFLLFEAMTLCAWVVAFYVGGTSGNPLLTLTLFSIGGMLMRGAKSAYLIRESGAGYRGSVLGLARHLLLSIIISLPSRLRFSWSSRSSPFLRIAGITAVAYYLLIFFTDTLVRSEIIGMVRGLVPPEHIDRMKRVGLF